MKEALNSYVNDPSFDDEVEIVISDNCSNDNTQKICEEYVSKFSNIKYYRNEENVYDVNFTMVLDRATGYYLKLMNDNIVMKGLGLSYLKERIKNNIDSKPMLFFTNGTLFNHEKSDMVICERFEDFIIYVSFYVTGIGLFGTWKEDWEKVTERRKFSHLQLAQDDWTYQLLENKGVCKLYTTNYSADIHVGKRAGYNWFKVHVDNYYAILQPYIQKGLVTHSYLLKEKKTYLKGIKTPIVMALLCRFNKDWQFDTTGTFGVLWKNFKEVPFFYLMMLTLPFWGGVLTFYKFWKIKTK